MIIFVVVHTGAKKEFIREVVASSFATPFHLIKKADKYFECAVRAPREKGKANERLIELLAEHLDVARSRIELVSGHTSREKMIRVH